MSKAIERIYVRMDADQIGDKLELLLIDGKLDDAKHLHESMQRTITELQERAIAAGFDLLYSGCDDVLFSKAYSSWEGEVLEELRAFFSEKTGCTLSCGVGFSLATALHNLRVAKLSGRDKIIGPS